jgi:hypothetical protein
VEQTVSQTTILQGTGEVTKRDSILVGGQTQGKLTGLKVPRPRREDPQGWKRPEKMA